MLVHEVLNWTCNSRIVMCHLLATSTYFDNSEFEEHQQFLTQERAAAVRSMRATKRAMKAVLAEREVTASMLALPAKDDNLSEQESIRAETLVAAAPAVAQASEAALSEWHKALRMTEYWGV